MNSSKASRMTSFACVLVLTAGMQAAQPSQDAAQAAPQTTPPAAPQAPAQAAQQSSRQAAPQESTQSEGQALHILVGKSVVVNVQTPITRVLSSNPAVIETLATSPTEVVVEGRAAGTSSLILWDQTGRSQMLDVIVDVDVTGLRNAIEHAFPDQQVSVQADGSRLILTGNVPDAKAIEDLTKMATIYSPQIVSSLQVVPLHERQILLEVKFAEVDRTKLDQ